MADHDGECLCRRCYESRHRVCILAQATAGRGDAHPDHRHPECPSTPPPALGATSTCRTCLVPITYTVVEEPGYNARTGWSDGFRRDALVCFRSIRYQHAPDRMYATTPLGARP